MNHSPKFYPWFLFTKILKIFCLSIFLFYITELTFHLFPHLLPDPIQIIFSSGISIMCFIFFLHSLLKPLGNINKMILHIENQLPYEQRLRIFYKKDDWSHIESAIALVQEQLEGQEKLIKDESNKNSLLLESINEGILAVDMEKNLLFYNSPFANIFLDEHQKLQKKGKIWSIISHPQILEAFDQTLSLNQMQTLRSFPHSMNKGAYFFDISLMPIFSEENQIGAVGVFHDITERKLIDQMRVDFVANISHEIRTPLTSIQGYSQLLHQKKNKFDLETQQSIDKILKNSGRMISLFNDLLQLSVIESQNSLTLEKIDIKSLCEHVVNNIKAIYPQKVFVVEYKIENEEIFVDEKLFERVLNNLIDNACKYSSSSPKLTISSYKENNLSIIKIKDHGPGIEENHLPRIFERFYRIDKSRDSTTGGTGLGLSIVKHIVQKHQGEISVESQQGSGTSFIIKLPKN